MWNTTGSTKIELRNGWGITAENASSRPVTELISVRGNRLVLILSDAVSPAWYNGLMANLLKDWMQSEIVVLLHLLPYSFWPRTGLVNAPRAYFRSTGLGRSNSRLVGVPASGANETLSAKDFVQLITLPFDPKVITSWAQAVSGHTNIWMPGVMLPLSEEQEQQRQEHIRAEQEWRGVPEKTDEFTTALALVEQYENSASPEAWRMAGYMSASVPLSLPLMRIIQRVMLPQSGREHLAEFYLSGLIRGVEGTNSLNEEEARYEFLPGVRRILLSSISRSEAAEVIQRTSQFIDRESGKSIEFNALVADPSLAAAIDPRSTPFAEVRLDLLRSLGGKYARLANALGGHYAIESGSIGVVNEEQKTIRYKAKRGDTLISIADRFGISVEMLLDYNPNLKKIGMELIIPDLESQADHGQQQTLEQENPEPQIEADAEIESPIQENPVTANNKIYISYRRADSTYLIGQIRERLIAAFGKQSVFDDLDEVPAGMDFRSVVKNELNSCNVMLVLIGPQWAGIADAHGNKRLFDPNDFTRIEVETGLKRLLENSMMVIPILVMNAAMPSADELPESLSRLVFQNARTLRNYPDFENDIERLIKDIKHPRDPFEEEIELFEPQTIYIPEGPFWMGSSPGEGIPPHETPQHEVYLPAYRIGKYPVTNAQYEIFIQQTKKSISPTLGWDGQRIPKGFEKHPVTGVTWYEALAYCQWLSEKTRRNYSLPTEAQWEKACRGSDHRIYPWGNVFDLNLCNQGKSKIAPVDAYPPQSASGGFDFVGNVQQWTRSLWGENRSAPDQFFRYPWNDDGRNALDANPQVRRVLRGSSFKNDPNDARCSARSGQFPDNAGSSEARYGFRIVLTLQEDNIVGVSKVSILKDEDGVKVKDEHLSTPESDVTKSPSGIDKSQSGKAAKILQSLRTDFSIEIPADWGDDSKGGWHKGVWTIAELDMLYKAVDLLAEAMRGRDKFIRNLGGMTIRKADIGSYGAESLAHRVSFSAKGSISAWSVVHELAHAWDANFKWTLSTALEKYTEGSTSKLRSQGARLVGNWDAGPNGEENKPGRHGRLPGCNAAGYFYGDKPSGSNWHFNRKEDFAESVAMYVGWKVDNELSLMAHGRIERYLLPNGVTDNLSGVRDNWADYAKYFYPEGGDYTKTKRWQFIDNLMKGEVGAL
ncbi:MAG: SUMF1/EgtB/PvdO family nonheme iron enzyme [Chloroflexi bacterium]|nr:SUMF1/EgtB/PvdO family nonheme iron enzyme [Chloroflexota bacterium]